MICQRVRILLLFALVGLLAGLASAQVETGSVVGTLRDASGAIVPNAQVVLTETQKSLHWQTTSNAAGYYAFPTLPPGEYQVQAKHSGFHPAAQTGITLAANQTVRIDLTLAVGSSEQTVNVSSAPPPIQTDSADVSKEISAKVVQDLPMGGTRNFQQLFLLVPGATQPQRVHSDFFNSQGSMDVHINGQPNVVNNLMIEGITDNERTGLLQIYIPPADAIQEVSVSTSNYDAQLGAGGGYVSNVILKTGSNQFHGDLFEFLRPDNYGSANPYCMVRTGQTCNSHYAPYHFNQFGGSIGGPIIHNKIFFFTDWQSTREHYSNTRTVTVPDAKFRQGDFSEALDNSTTGYKGADVIYDPTTGNADGSGRAAFANNTIPQSVLTSNPAWPIIQKIMSLWPMPNMGGTSLFGNYRVDTPGYRDNDQFDVKIDGQMSEANNFSYRFSWMRPKNYQAGVFGLAGGNGDFDANGTDTTYQSGLEWTHTFGSNLISETRAGVSRYRNVANPLDYGQNTADQLGIKGVNLQPFLSGIPTISPNGGITSLGYAGSLPWIRTETDFDLVNNWTWIVGNHTIIFGADLARLRDDLLQDQTYGPRGQFQFYSDGTGLFCPKGACASDVSNNATISQNGIANGFASFLLDYTGFAGRDLPVVFPALRQTRMFSFIGDKWQANPRLTVTMGLRDELYSPLKPHFPGGLSNYDPTTNTLQLAGIGNVPMGLGLKTSFRNLDPRLGLAYRLSSSSVLRAGFGISTVPFYDNNYAFNYPVRQNNGYTSANSYQQATLPGSNQLVNLASGMPAPSPAVIPSNGIIPATGALLSQSFEAVPTGMHEGYVEMWNLAYARQLPGHFTLDTAYVGDHGVDILYHRNINAGLAPGCGNKCLPLGLAFGKTVGVDQFTPMGNNYNGLQVKLDRRFSSGLVSTTTFVWSKAIDFGGGTDMPGLADNVNFSRDRGRADFDTRTSLTEGFVYPLPFGGQGRWAKTGVAGAILGGWQLNGILSMHSGMPFGVSSSTSLNWTGVNQMANQVAPFKVQHGIGYGAPWFDPSSFTNPDPNTLGTLGRNMFSGPGYFNMDASLFRTLQITERVNLQLRIESFNTTNTPAFNNPSSNRNSSTFGMVTGESKASRNLQFGLKLSF